MSIISLDGFCDLHIHTGPDLFRRIGDTVEIARHAKEKGLHAIVSKSHFCETSVKAFYAARDVEGIHVFSGIVLNRFVGGINPVAVALALSLGAKIVWMPTVDAANHIRAFGGADYGIRALEIGFTKRFKDLPGLTVLKNGHLTDAVKEIVQLVVEHNAVLATSHLSKEEIYELVAYTRSIRYPKVLITHPEYTVPKLSVDEVRQLAKEEVYFEFCGVNCFPVTHTITLDGMRTLIEAVGPERGVLSSDGGQFFNPMPAEILRVFVQGLHEKGVPADWISMMASKNPRYLLGL